MVKIHLIKEDAHMYEKRRAQVMNNEEHGTEEAYRDEIHQGMNMGHPGMQKGGHPGMEMGRHPGKNRMGKNRMGKPGPGMGGMSGHPEMGEEYDEMGQPLHTPVYDPIITTYEMYLILFALLFLINMFIGKARNYKFAKVWYFANKEYLFNNYSHIGVIIDKKKEAIALMKETYSTYKVYASGRINCKWMMCSLEVEY
jgi:hypothetical protein